MEDKKENKTFILVLIGIIGLCLITIGLTYAYWILTKQQTGENVVNTACLNINFIGENDITLDKAYPMKPEELEIFLSKATPYHFTIFATNKENQDRMLEIAEKININKIQLKVNDIKIMTSRYGSYCLYLSIEENQQIKELQRIFYKEFPKEKYNPDDFTFHMTLHIDKDYNKVLNLQKILKENFKAFFLEFNTLALFDYPGEMIKKINFNKE